MSVLTRELAPFDDLTRLAGRMLDSVDEILEKGNIEALVMLKSSESHKYGLASNAESDIPLMLIMSLAKVCGGLSIAKQLITKLDAEWDEAELGPKI